MVVFKLIINLFFIFRNDWQNDVNNDVKHFNNYDNYENDDNDDDEIIPDDMLSNNFTSSYVYSDTANSAHAQHQSLEIFHKILLACILHKCWMFGRKFSLV